MRKHRHFKVKGFLYFSLGKGGFPQYEKSMAKRKHFKFMGFLNISGGTENHTTPKTWEKEIDITQEKYGKKQTFESYDFLKYFR